MHLGNILNDDLAYYIWFPFLCFKFLVFCFVHNTFSGMCISVKVMCVTCGECILRWIHLVCFSNGGQLAVHTAAFELPFSCVNGQ